MIYIPASCIVEWSAGNVTYSSTYDGGGVEVLRDPESWCASVDLLSTATLTTRPLSLGPRLRCTKGAGEAVELGAFVLRINDLTRMSGGLSSMKGATAVPESVKH